MKIKLTTLVENDAKFNSGLISEHGFSVFVESPHGNILFDTGQSDAFLKNAKVLGVPIETIKKVVISHAHYDHSGGFMSLMDAGIVDFRLIVSQFFFREKFKKTIGDIKYIGNNFNTYDLATKNIEISTISSNVTEISPKIYVVTNFKRNCEYEPLNEKFLYRTKEGYSVDPFLDEIALVIRSKKGLVVIFGCSHPGAINMLDSIDEYFSESIYMLLGGLHLRSSEDERILKTIDKIKELKIEKIGVSHCTGKHTSEMMKEVFGEKYFENITGTCIKFK